jgi:hypothetical protein
MATFLLELTLAAGSVAMAWLITTTIQQARRIYNFHEELS